MTTQTNPITEYVEGTVSRINGHGFQLVGRDGWLNVSKYANPIPAVPCEGVAVRVGLDKAGYARTVEPVTAGAAETCQNEAEPTRAATREQQITRMGCLNTATAILASGAQTVNACLWRT